MTLTKTKKEFLVARVRKMLFDGFSVAQTAAELKYSAQAIYLIIKEHNIPKPKRPPNKLIDKIRELAEKKMTVRAIAKEINRNVSTTFDYMVRNNIPRNGRQKNGNK